VAVRVLQHVQQREHAGHELHHAVDPRRTDSADLVPSPAGETQDYGIKLSLLRNRVFVTATEFHTKSQREFGFSGFNRGNVINIWTALANAGVLNAEETNFARRQTEVMNQVQGYTQDSESKGSSSSWSARSCPAGRSP
jgi:hypothetical protein